MKLPETKKAVKGFNRLARVLVEYELVFLKLWARQMERANAGLSATVLVRHEGQLIVNMDAGIGEHLREVDLMAKMGLELPAQAGVFVAKARGVKEKEESLRVRVCVCVW